MDNARLEKFKNRAKMIVSPDHLAKIMATFPKSQHARLRSILKHNDKSHLLK